MTSRRLAGFAARALLPLVPFGLFRRLFKVWAVMLSEQRDPRRAVRQLFTLAGVLEPQIDMAAIRYNGGVHAKHRVTGYHDFFVERVHPGERVLDVGCGKGELAYDLADRAGVVVVGIDIDRAYLAFARGRFVHPRLTFVEADALAELPGGWFDAIVLSNVLEHIDRRAELLRRLVEHCRPERLLIRVPASDRHWTVPLREELGLPHFSDPTHFVEYRPESFRAEMAEAGLETEELRVTWGEIWAAVRPVRPDA